MITEWLITRRHGRKFFRWIAKNFRSCEVHPDAKIGKNIRLGHGGKGIVVGNCRIGDNVLIMHNVSLVNDFISKDAIKKGFPSIEDRVIIGTGSIIIGGRVIGKGSIIGAGSIITKDILPNSITYNEKKTIIKSRK